MTTTELRTTSEFEARQGTDGSWKVGGYGSTFNDPYEVHDRFGSFTETILPPAWDRTLANRGHKIQLLDSHNGLPFAASNTKAFRLGTDGHGLHWDWDVPSDTQRALDIAHGIRDGYITEMSVGMRIPTEGDSWNADMSERQISEATLMEISFVARGANPHTEAAMRAAYFAALEEPEEVPSLQELQRALAQREPRDRKSVV